jgi:hypothetical protein
LANKLLFDVIDEQVAVAFTGKINILDVSSSQLYGFIAIYEGEIITVIFKKVGGQKAFYNILIEESEQQSFRYVVEPEIVTDQDKNIHYPVSVLKSRAQEVLENYQASKSNKPPQNIKLSIDPEFITSNQEVSGDEYDLLLTISDYNRVEDIYQNCPLLDYEITNALVSLRRKKALKVIQLK